VEFQNTRFYYNYAQLLENRSSSLTAHTDWGEDRSGNGEGWRKSRMRKEVTYPGGSEW